MKYAELKAGMVLRVTKSEFGCLKLGETRTVKFANPKDGFYIQCMSGQHFLDLQICGEDELFGFELVGNETIKDEKLCPHCGKSL